MISPDHCRLMARYNRWQNGSLIAAATPLGDEARARDCGAFFGSVQRTFNHLLWDDRLWLARFAGDERAEQSITAELDQPADWSSFVQQREALDGRITAWADAMAETTLAGETAWYPGGGDTRMARPTWQCAAHLFNHQTHHRGQIHAMLTSLGASPEPTDLPMLEIAQATSPAS